MDLSIVIPMYNCESTINNVLNSIHDFIDKCDENVEVICIDDGSKDSTASIVEKFIKNNDIFSLIKKENGGGKFSTKYRNNKGRRKVYYVS